MRNTSKETSSIFKDNVADNCDEWMVSSITSYDERSLFELLTMDDSVIFFEYSPYSGKVNLSDTFYSITGLKNGSIRNIEQLFTVIESDKKFFSQEQFKRFEASKSESMDFEFQLKKKNGSTMWTAGFCKKVRIPETNSVFIVGVANDVTKIKLAEIELRENMSLYDMFFSGKSDAIVHHDPFKDEIHFSDSFYDMLGYEVGSISTFKEFCGVVVNGDYDVLKKQFDDFIHSEEIHMSYENQLRKSDGTSLWVLTNTKKVWRPGESNFILVGMEMDITRRKEAELEVERLAYYDNVIEMPNRVYFKMQLDEAVENNLNGYLLLFDIDDFKAVNDIFGHKFGDRILVEFASRLERELPTDSFIGRHGADEFTAIVYANSHEEIDVITSQLMDMLRLPYEIDGKTIHLTSSIGIVDLKVENKGDLDHLVLAGITVSQAKKNGKNQKEFYRTDFLSTIQRGAEIEHALRTAVSDNELYCVFQPIFDAKTMEIYSFETLLRFNSKELGFVSPGEFIPVSEKTGQIIEIGTYGIFEAAKKVEEWYRKGYKFEKVNFNVSHVGVTSKVFLEELEHITSSIGIPHHMITLELTESGLIEFQDDIREQMYRTIGLGTSFSIDDFGTGFSSLQYLSESVFGSLKIDMSYVQRITSSEQDEKLVRNLIYLAHALGMKAVAEGVETKEQLDLLLDMQIDYLQGFYLSKPLLADEAEELLKSKM